MKMKLADYGTTGKFERFLELGTGLLNKNLKYKDSAFQKDFNDGVNCNFLFGGDCIIILYQEFHNGSKSIDGFRFDRDEKDPLNRFNGLFSGRTFGEGRFVIVIDDCDDVRTPSYTIVTSSTPERPYSHTFLKGEVMGNLHQNPELFSKLEQIRWPARLN